MIVVSVSKVDLVFFMFQFKVGITIIRYLYQHATMTSLCV